MQLSGRKNASIGSRRTAAQRQGPAFVFMEQHARQHLLIRRLPTTSDRFCCFYGAWPSADTPIPQWFVATHSTYRQDHAVLEIGKFAVTLLTAV